MRLVFALCLAFILIGCDWGEKADIRQDLEDIYSAPLCFKFSVAYPFVIDTPSSDNQAIQYLYENEFLTKKKTRQNEGLLGYSITDGYFWSKKSDPHINDNQLCYGTQSVNTIKIVDRDGDKRQVSFALVPKVSSDWKKHKALQKWIKLNPQLLRKTLVKDTDGQWRIKN